MLGLSPRFGPPLRFGGPLPPMVGILFGPDNGGPRLPARSSSQSVYATPSAPRGRIFGRRAFGSPLGARCGTGTGMLEPPGPGEGVGERITPGGVTGAWVAGGGDE